MKIQKYYQTLLMDPNMYARMSKEEQVRNHVHVCVYLCDDEDLRVLDTHTTMYAWMLTEVHVCDHVLVGVYLHGEEELTYVPAYSC
jgi:hypothetical protein